MLVKDCVKNTLFPSI